MDGVFRIYAKNFSLTYPQCSVPKETLLQHLQSMQPDYICVSKELHNDGHPHLHAALCFSTKKNVRSPSYFDFQGYHPNIQATKKINEWITYVKKGMDFIEYGTPPISASKAGRLHKLSDIPTDELRDYCVNNNIGKPK